MSGHGEHESHAGIVAEIRARAGAWMDDKLKQYDERLADRFDAAHKREAAFHAMTCDANDRLREHLQIALDANKRERDSSAAMRETLENVAKQLIDATEDENFGEDVMYLVGCMRTMSRKCRSALATTSNKNTQED